MLSRVSLWNWLLSPKSIICEKVLLKGGGTGQGRGELGMGGWGSDGKGDGVRGSW